MPKLSDPDATLEPGLDPTEDTQTEDAEDTAQDTQGTVDWEARYKQLQAFSTKRERDLTSRLEALEQDGDEAEDDEEEQEADEEDEPDEGSARLERDSWTLAEKTYGRTAVTAYGKAARLLDRASTPSDYVAAFEAYYSDRLDAEMKRAARQSGGSAQAQSAQPPIDSNRSDAAPRDYDAQTEAALAKGDSRGFLLAQIQRLRGER